MAKRPVEKKVEDDPRYHDTWRLLKKYRDVVWSLELSVQQLKKQFETMLGNDPLHNPDFVRIINRKHFDRLLGLLEGEPLLCGGRSRADDVSGWIEPTLVDVSDPESCKPMQEEIFGPILPVISYDTLDEAIAFVNARPKPLALYLFTKNKRVKEQVLRRCSYGGGCINDTIIHLATHEMPFGGVGNSGMGGYHGRFSFDTFSHTKSIVDKACWIDMPLRYFPYSRKLYDKMIHFFMR